MQNFDQKFKTITDQLIRIIRQTSHTDSNIRQTAQNAVYSYAACQMNIITHKNYFSIQSINLAGKLGFIISANPKPVKTDLTVTQFTFSILEPFILGQKQITSDNISIAFAKNNFLIVTSKDI